MSEAHLRFSGRRIWRGVGGVLRRRWLPMLAIFALSVGWSLYAAPGIALLAESLLPISPRLPWAVNWIVHGVRDGVDIGLVLSVSLLAAGARLRDLVSAALRPIAGLTAVALMFHSPDIGLDLLPQYGLAQSLPQAMAEVLLLVIGPARLAAKASVFGALALAPAVIVAARASLPVAIAEGWRIGRGLWWRLALTSITIEIAANLPGLFFAFNPFSPLVRGAEVFRTVVYSTTWILQLMLAAQFYREAERLRTGVGAEPVDTVFG